MKDKILLALKSRRVWTFIVIFIINGMAAVSDMIPQGILDVINPLLAVLGVYFGVTPKNKV